MGQKVKPNAYRIGISLPWQNRWFYHKNLRYFLEEDFHIRRYLREKVLQAGIASIEIERTSGAIRVIVRAARPGLIIGRGGKGIEELRAGLLETIKKCRRGAKIGVVPARASGSGGTAVLNLNLNIEELKRSDVSAAVVAQQVAFDIEKRLPFRRVMRRTLETTMQNREAQGAKIRLSGRLNGAEISRNEWLAKGRMPLQTLRANVDYGEATAFNTYGTIGVKIWIYKGDVFEKKNDRESARM
ncbi:MAG: 30S ribosomal protein S3 [Candidatus Brennerbacteria bacterium]|nr:30S ribosomal protein S3 [Candidatus Brennerbacteria bacterium]